MSRRDLLWSGLKTLFVTQSIESLVGCNQSRNTQNFNVEPTPEKPRKILARKLAKALCEKCKIVKLSYGDTEKDSYSVEVKEGEYTMQLGFHISKIFQDDETSYVNLYSRLIRTSPNGNTRYNDFAVPTSGGRLDVDQGLIFKGNHVTFSIDANTLPICIDAALQDMAIDKPWAPTDL